MDFNIIIISLLIFSALILQMYFLGFLIIRKWMEANLAVEKNNIWIRNFFFLSTGFAADNLFVTGCGFIGLLIPSVVISFLLFSCVAGMILFVVNLKSSRVRVTFSFPSICYAIGTIGVLILLVLLCLHVPNRYDETMYHLPLARDYLEQGKVFFLPYSRYPFFPQFGEMMFSLTLMLGGERCGDILCQEIATLPVFLSWVGLVGVLKKMYGWTWLGFVVLPIFLFLSAKMEMGYAYVDCLLGFYCWASILSLFIGLKSKEQKFFWIALAGVFTGMASGSKYFGLFFSLLCLAWLLLAEKNMKGVLVFTLTAFFAGSCWYLRNIAIAGNPVEPFAHSIFGYYLWSPGDIATQFGDINERYALPVTLGNFVNIFDGKGLTVFLLLPLCLIKIRRFKKHPILYLSCSREVFMMFAISVLFLCFWIYAFQYIRYVAPVYVAVLFLVTVGCVNLVQGARTILGPFCLNALNFLNKNHAEKNIFSTLKTQKMRFIGNCFISLLCLFLTFLTARFCYSNTYVKYHIENWEKDLLSQTGYKLYKKSNELIPQYGDRVVNVFFEQTKYYFKGTSIGDWFGPGRYSQMTDPKDQSKLIAPRDMLGIMNKHQARILIFKKTLVFDVNDYNKYFDLIYSDDEGFLFVVK